MLYAQQLVVILHGVNLCIVPTHGAAEIVLSLNVVNAYESEGSFCVGVCACPDLTIL